jgi:hypothetical protein
VRASELKRPSQADLVAGAAAALQQAFVREVSDPHLALAIGCLRRRANGRRRAVGASRWPYEKECKDDYGRRHEAEPGAGDEINTLSDPSWHFGSPPRDPFQAGQWSIVVLEQKVNNYDSQLA